MPIPDNTLAALRALNDLDLGALARNAGIYSHMELTPERLQVVAAKVQTPKDIGGLIAWLGGGVPGAQHLATLGAKVRAALSAEQTADLEVCEDLAKQKAEVARLRGLLDSRTLADALTLTKPLRIAMGWPRHRAQTAEQIIAEAVTTLNEYPAIMQAANDRAEKAEASQRAGVMHYEIKINTEAARAQLAELQAAVEAQTEAAKKASEQQALLAQTTLGKPDEPITVARALLKQAASTVDLADRLALVIEARQWAALDR